MNGLGLQFVACACCLLVIAGGAILFALMRNAGAVRRASESDPKQRQMAIALRVWHAMRCQNSFQRLGTCDSLALGSARRSCEQFRDLLDRIDTGEGVELVQRSSAMEALRCADVVLVPDDHSFSAVQSAFARIVREAASGGDAREVTGLAIEALPKALGDSAAGAHEWSVTEQWREFGDLVRRYWPWPVAGYETWARTLGVPLPRLVAVGGGAPLELAAPPADDRCRSPATMLSVAQIANEAIFVETAENTVSAVQWLRQERGEATWVWCLLGGLHVLDPDVGAKSLLERASLRVCVALVWEPRLEIAACLRWGETGRTSCVAFGRGIFYVPMIDDRALEAHADFVGAHPCR